MIQDKQYECFNLHGFRGGQRIRLKLLRSFCGGLYVAASDLLILAVAESKTSVWRWSDLLTILPSVH